MSVRTAPYGSWQSPIDAAAVALHGTGPDFVGVVGGEVWWVARRPAEGGRSTLMRRRRTAAAPDRRGGGGAAGAGASPGTEECVLPAPWNVRSRVIEYGGLPWAGAVSGDGPLVVFVHFADQRLYAFRPDAPGAADAPDAAGTPGAPGAPDAAGAEPWPLTPLSPVGGGLRWVEPRIDLPRAEVWCVLEEFTGPAPTDVRRVIAAVPLDGSAAEDRTAIRELTDDRHRFLTGPRLSPDGRRAVWIAWDHPAMPWDATELKIADVAPDGTFGAARTVLSGASVAQADWSADGSLLAATDRTGWWNLHRVDPDSGSAENLHPGEEEYAGPAWRIGLRWFTPLDSGLVAVLHGRGPQRLGLLDPVTGELAEAPGPWQEWAPTLAADGTRVVGVAATATTGYEVVELDTATGRARVVGAAHTDLVDPAYLPRPVPLTATGPGGREVHAWVYAPANPCFTAPHGEPPPYAVWVHGGPTSHASAALDLAIAYFTSRGIGVVQVDYGGSTGYGRAYRERLRGRWGVVDVEDCVAVAEALAAGGQADRRRLAIRGGSAGGWTAAAALTAVDTFACGAIRFPVLDLRAFADGGTHDFESRYTWSLVGPPDEVPERYRDRSPAHRAERVTAPFVLLQGLEDAVCPPAQCDRFLERVARRGVPHAYLAFPGEGHGFRRQETIVAALEAELSLYGQVFGFDPHGVRRLELVR